MSHRTWSPRKSLCLLFALVSLSACEEPVSTSINVKGLYTADEAQAPFFDTWIVGADSDGNPVDTIAHVFITTLQFEFLDREPNPDEWDDARLHSTTVCEAHSPGFDCESAGGERSTDVQVHRYLATIDTLRLRDYGPEAWAVVPWLGEQAGFEVVFRGNAESRPIRFLRGGS